MVDKKNIALFKLISFLNTAKSVDEIEKGLGIKRRTFFNYKNDIEDILGIDIVCYNKLYKIDVSEQENEGGKVLLNLIGMKDVIDSASQMQDRIFVENITPFTSKFLPDIIRAMKENKIIKIKYKPLLNVDETRELVLKPMCVKQFQQNWYLFAYETKDTENLSCYALFSIESLKITSTSFAFDNDIVAGDFANQIGVSHGLKAERITFSETVVEGYPSVVQFPLHSSQFAYKNSAGENVYDIEVGENDELYTKFLSYGGRLKVLSPEHIKNSYKELLQKMLDEL